MEYKESREEGQRGTPIGNGRPPPSRRLVSPQETKDAILLSPCYCLIFERGKRRRERAISAIERGCAVYVCDQPNSSTHPDLLKHYLNRFCVIMHMIIH